MSESEEGPPGAVSHRAASEAALKSGEGALQAAGGALTLP